jgi:hypothetical protein
MRASAAALLMAALLTGSVGAHGLSAPPHGAFLYAHSFGTGQTRKFHVSHPWSLVWQYGCVNSDRSLMSGGGIEVAVLPQSGPVLWSDGAFNPRGATGSFDTRKTGTFYVRVGTPCRWQVWVFQ